VRRSLCVVTYAALLAGLALFLLFYFGGLKDSDFE